MCADSKLDRLSLTEAVDTTTPAGGIMMRMVGAFAEFERAMLKKRAKAGRTQLARKVGSVDAFEAFRSTAV